MKLNKCILVSAFTFLLFATAETKAGTFWFPIEGVYPYTAKVTAVPDLDQNLKSIRVRTGETGKYTNGCKAYNGKYPCTAKYVKDLSVWGYEKDGGGNWDVDGILIVSDLKYMWYDNHSGYDFAYKTYFGKIVHAVEDGVISQVSAPWGQIGIKHLINGITYYTYYTHMDISKTQLNLPAGKKVKRWDVLGTVSDTGVKGAIHLHFTVKKGSKIVDPYGEWKNGQEVEPYLWE